MKAKQGRVHKCRIHMLLCGIAWNLSPIPQSSPFSPRLFYRGLTKKSSPDLGGGCAGQREGAGRGTLPNVAIDNPAGLVSKMSKV